MNEYVKTSNFIKPVSTEDINGGCTLVLGCNTSSYFVKSYTSSCSNKSLHTQLALYVAKNKVKKPGSYKVTGSTYGTVSYLG